MRFVITSQKISKQSSLGLEGNSDYALSHPTPIILLLKHSWRLLSGFVFQLPLFKACNIQRSEIINIYTS